MTYETLPDEELAKRAQSNDSAAVNELLHRHKSLVNKAVRRFFLPSGDTDDLVQEGMVALFNAIMNYDEKAGASFTTFAYICVRKRIIGLIRKSSSGKNRALNDSVPLDDIEIASGNPETVYIEEERETLLMREIESVLSEEEQRIFTLILTATRIGKSPPLFRFPQKSRQHPAKNKKIAEKIVKSLTFSPIFALHKRINYL